jgi:hypothetical protein
MVIGELGAVGLPVQELAGEELRLAADFVIALHRPMEELLALDPAQKLFLATPPLVEQVNFKICFKNSVFYR